jgi:hypothetical protein
VQQVLAALAEAAVMQQQQPAQAGGGCPVGPATWGLVSATLAAGAAALSVNAATAAGHQARCCPPLLPFFPCT